MRVAGEIDAAGAGKWAVRTGPAASRSLPEPVDITDCESESDKEEYCCGSAATTVVTSTDTRACNKASKAAAAHDALQIDADRCPICLDTVQKGYRTPCGHLFCSTCLAHALFRNDSCPVCRSGGVHTCAAPRGDCPLCVVGHMPGVVVPNVYVSEEHARRRLIVALTRLQRCISIGVVGLVAFLCSRGMLPIVVVGVLGTFLALANKVNHWLGPCARFSRAVKRLLLGQIPWRSNAPRVNPAVEAV